MIHILHPLWLVDIQNRDAATKYFVRHSGPINLVISSTKKFHIDRLRQGERHALKKSGSGRDGQEIVAKSGTPMLISFEV